MSIAEFPVLSNFGLAIALVMGLALLSAFVFMPAVVLLLTRFGVVPAGAGGDQSSPEPDVAVPDDD